MKWTYGKAIVEQCDLNNLDNWSDEKELIYSFFDQCLDYVWYEHEDGVGITFRDRLYDSFECDDQVKERIENGTATIVFNNYDEVMTFIGEHGYAKKFVEHLKDYIEV